MDNQSYKFGYSTHDSHNKKLLYLQFSGVLGNCLPARSRAPKLGLQKDTWWHSGIILLPPLNDGEDDDQDNNNYQ